ncbi:Uma2 family endonuclease [Phormidesmis sp. 146-12]
MTTITAKWTLDEYHRLVDAGFLDDRHVELLRGELVEMAPEGKPHAHLSTNAGTYLIRLLGDRAMIRPAKPITLLENGSEPEPDLAIVQPLGREYLDHHPYPENIFWVVEYSYSSLDKDLEIKSKLYAEAGILEYWVVNLKTFKLIVFRDPQDGEYASKMTLSTGTLQPVTFPNIAVSVDRIING